jgi:ribosomal protein L24E
MTRVDTFFDGRDIYEHNGLYYITKDGEIISPAFVSLKDAWKNAWKYQ